MIVDGHPSELNPGLHDPHPPHDPQLDPRRRLIVNLDPELHTLQMARLARIVTEKTPQQLQFE